MQLLHPPLHHTEPKTLVPPRRSTPLIIRCRQSDFQDPQCRPAAQPFKLFVGYSIYKGKTALSVEPRAPEFAPVESGAYRVSKEGMMMMQFAPAVGTRQYDWNRKQIISLSVAELASLMALGARDSCEFFHDPFKGKSEEGKIRKIFKVEPLADGSGHLFNLSVQNRIINVDENLYIPISRGEFTLLNSAFSFIIPYLLGWHVFANSIRPESSLQPNHTKGAELEWNR